MSDQTAPASAESHSTGLRGSVERASAPLLRRLVTLPPWLPFLAMLALILLGSLLGGLVGGVAVALAGLVIAWLLYLAWPRLGGAERLMRLAVLAVVVAVALTQLFPR